MKQFFFFLLFGCNFLASAQNAQQAIEKLYQSYPQEKVVLSFSKNEYLAGETIYFKAYVLTGYELSDISTNLYTELYDKHKQLVKQLFIPLLKGSGEGSIDLPASLSEDVYYVRAYTQYMLNYPESFQYIKPINIYNPSSPQKLRSKAVQWTAVAVAEGGTMLNDLPSMLSVRLNSTGRLPESWQGTLKEKATGNVIGPVNVLNNQVGTISFSPKAFKEYTITIKDNEGLEQVINVPKSKENGVALHLDVADDKLDYSIRMRNTAANGAGYKLVGTMHDRVVFMATIKRSNGLLDGSIDITNLPAGVLLVTLFDDKETPLNERLCFIHQQVPTVQPNINFDTISFATKTINSWQINVDSVNWASYLVQVEESAYAGVKTFISDVYLASDFTMPIENAFKYFTDVSVNNKKALDALLIGEKWARFNWSDILASRFPVLRFYPDKYLSYTAMVRKGKNLQPLKDVNLILKSKEGPMQIVPAKTDSAGGFILTNLVFIDTTKVYYKANDHKFFDKELDVSFERMNKFQPYNAALPSSPFEVGNRSKGDTIPAAISRAIKQKSNEQLLNDKIKMMEEVIITTKAKNATKALNDKLSSALFSSTNETVIDFVNEDQGVTAYNNVFDWLDGRVAGLTFRIKNENELRPDEQYKAGLRVPMMRDEEATIYIDEMQSDVDAIYTLSPADIALVKVIKGYFVGATGGGAGGGAIAIYTKRGNSGKSSTPNMPSNILIGYPKTASFMLPDYAQESFSKLADQRDILFRSSLLYPSKNWTAPVRFYNNDSAKTFRVFIAGFTSDGRVVYLNKLVQ